VGCIDDLGCGADIAPQQIELFVTETTPAALVDPWGFPHHLAKTMSIGRAAERELVILDASVSRSHAELNLVGRGWRLRDVGSTCGTYVDERQIVSEIGLQDGDRVRFGDVAFYFVHNTIWLPPLPQRDVGTMRIPRSTTQPMPRVERATLPVQLRSPSGGGGGFVVIDGKHVQLTTAQYELVELLVQRMIAESDKPDAVRGFVHPQELMKLSLESADPNEDHVRQLVRRVRRALDKAEHGDLIEARRGMGYRLRVIPRV